MLRRTHSVEARVDDWRQGRIGGWRAARTGTSSAGNDDRRPRPATSRDHPAACRGHDAKADRGAAWGVARDGKWLVPALSGAAPERTGRRAGPRAQALATAGSSAHGAGESGHAA